MNRLVVTGTALGSCLVGLLLTMIPSPSIAQQPQSRPLPRQEYYQVFDSIYYQGKYQTAARQLKSFSNSAYRDKDGFFFDSICYWTMLGECAFHVGEYAQAVEHYEAALNLYMNFPNWPLRVHWPEAIQTDGAGTRRSQVPWTNTERRFSVGRFNDSLLMDFGQTPQQNQQAAQQGGTIDLARLRSVDVTETMRCVALALQRRRMIKGPTCQYDPFSRQLASSLANGGDGSIGGAWRGVAKGIALSSIENWDGATRMLTNSLQIGGSYDHPLTAIALLELGHIAEQQGDLAKAQKYFMEASVTGAAFQQFDVIEHALRRASNLFLVGRSRQEYPPLELAISWAAKERVKPLHASLLIQAATVSGESGDASNAQKLLDQARRKMTGREMRATRLMTRWSYVAAMAYYLQDDVARGDDAFADFLQSAGNNSFWLYQLSLADTLVKTSRATEREAELLYDAVLREPLDRDWLLEPIETMAFHSTPHFEPMERWFEITLSRKAEEKAIAISEMIRRQRFFSTLPFGGRMLGFRWVLEAPEEALSKKAMLQKQDLLIRYPAFKELADASKKLREELEKLPLVPDDKTDEQLQQRQKLEQLTGIATQQELLLRKMVLQREPCEMAFPPPLNVADIQRGLTPKQMIVALLKIGSRYYVFSLGLNRYSIENAVQAKLLDRRIMELTKKLGVADKATINDASIFLSDDWRQSANEITKLIFPKAEAKTLDDLDEVIFVPDGKAWYLPMELLQFGTAEQTANLSDHVKVRYAPMMSLAIPDRRVNRRFGRAGVIAKRNFLRDDDAVISQGLTQLQSELPEIVAINKMFPGPSSVIASTIDQLVVWHDNKELKRQGPYAMAPLQLDQGKPGADLSSWMMFPWQGVAQILMPGYSSGIEGKGRSRADGQDLFLTSCGLMSSGARTLLISRWRVGGRSTLDLTREFALQLGKDSVIDAWDRSVKLLHQSELDIDQEPRVRKASLAEPLKADHPFFWAGYMLIDSGSVDPSTEKEPGDEMPVEQGAGDGGR